MPTSPLSARLRAARLASGQPQSRAAVAAGIDPGHLSRLERGLARPSPATLQRLCAVLNVDLYAVLDDDHSPADA